MSFDTLFSDVTVVTMDESQPLIQNAYLGVKDGKIAHLSKIVPQESAKMTIDCKDKVLIPGLINTHTHLPMSLLRGYSDDLKLHEWLDLLMPIEASFDAEDIKAGTMLALAEALSTGVTSISDMYLKIPLLMDCIKEVGIKANMSDESIAHDPNDIRESDQYLESLNSLYRKWHNFDQGRIKFDVGIHAEYTSSKAIIKRNAKFAKAYGLNMHLHLSETKEEHDKCVEKYGMTPTQLFEELGVFKNPVSAAHCVWVTDEDIEILKENQVNVLYNPVSNLKLCSGIAPVLKLKSAGVNIALGTDGASSNNSMDMFEEMKIGTMIQNNDTKSPSSVLAFEALKMATVNGALSQGREKECGQIKLGFDADLALLDFSKPHLKPCHDVVSNIVFAARGSDVCMTMVRGTVLYENGHFSSIDYHELCETLNNIVLRFIKAGQAK